MVIEIRLRSAVSGLRPVGAWRERHGGDNLVIRVLYEELGVFVALFQCIIGVPKDRRSSSLRRVVIRQEHTQLKFSHLSGAFNYPIE